MPKTPMATVQAVAAYADRFHAAVPGDHHVASPLGAWLLLAMAGTAVTDRLRPAYEEVLGTSVAEAARAARELLADPHPAVAAAVALWTRASVRTAGFGHWSGTLPAQVEQGELPDQTAADRWAADHTNGMINEFPVRIGADTLLILATALATRIRWTEPFDVAPGDCLGGDFAPQVATALRAPKQHSAAIVTTDAGDVALHSGGSADGLELVSVIADPSVGRRRVLAAAHEVAAVIVAGGLYGRTRDLFDLPLGPGPAWTITESRYRGQSHADRSASWTVTLPAWDAQTRVDLLADPAYGFGAAVTALTAALGPDSGVDPDASEAAQAAVARYGRYGFEAAAATALAAQRSAAPGSKREVVHRHAELRFGHPYAVVAMARQQVPRPGPWHGLPVFSAWVSEPTEA